MVGAGLAEKCRLEDSLTRFKYKSLDTYHGHPICTRCGAIIEIENKRIEALQNHVA
jgi:Fur family ferric uptake transcriptional regulator